MRKNLLHPLLLILLLVCCKQPEIKEVLSPESKDYVEADFCLDYDEQEVTVENYEALLDSIGAALDTLSSPSRCVAPWAQMNAVLLKVDSITKPEGFMDRKRAYNEYYSVMLDSLEKADADDPWIHSIAEILVNDRLLAMVKNRISIN